MGHLIELDSPAVPIHFTRRVPSHVRRFDAVEMPDGRLLLRWNPPARVAPVDRYWIERSRDGSDNELLGETDDLNFSVPAPPLQDPWVDRVRAVNARGAGRAKLLFCFERRRFRWHREMDGREFSLLLPIAVVPGLQVCISEFETQ